MTALDPKFPTQSLEVVVPELRAIVMDDSSRHSEPVYQIVLYKFHKIRCLHFIERDSLGPFVEIVSSGQYEPVILATGWGNWSDYIDPPNVKMPGVDSWM